MRDVVPAILQISARLQAAAQQRSRRMVIITSIVMSGVLVFTYSMKRPFRPAPLRAADALSIYDTPHAMPPIATPCFAASSTEHRAIQAIKNNPPIARLDGPVAIHLLRVYRCDKINRPDITSGADVLGVLTGFSSRDADFPLVQTRDGVRYRTDASRSDVTENHRDVFLATFAEAGLPLSTPLKTESLTKSSLRDVLRDSMANFDLKQPEIEWSAIAYTLYMPRDRKWCDRDGRTFTFDQLATELLARDLSKSSCGGTHVLLAMTYLMRVDADTSCLSEALRARLKERLREVVKIAVQAQNADGSWCGSWSDKPRRQRAESESEYNRRLLATGHVLEWLEHVPADLQPNAEIYPRAGGWLITELQKMRHAPTRNAPGSICPWAHAACALRNLCSENPLYFQQSAAAAKPLNFIHTEHSHG